MPAVLLSSRPARNVEALFHNSASISLSTLSFLLFSHPMSRLPRPPPIIALLLALDRMPIAADAPVLVRDVSAPPWLSIDVASLGIILSSSSAWICCRSPMSTEETKAKYSVVAAVNCCFCCAIEEIFGASLLGATDGPSVRALIARPADRRSLTIFYYPSVYVVLESWGPINNT